MSLRSEWKTRASSLLIQVLSFKSFIHSCIRFFVQLWKEIIERGFLREFLFFSLFSILLTIIMRILFTLEWRSLYPSETTKYISIYILQQDCIGSLLICSGALFIRILVPENKIRLGATFLGFYFFLVAVCYISDLHYIRYSENHLLLSHLQEGGLDFDLWFFSIPKEIELSWFFKLFLSGLAAWCWMYFYQRRRIAKTSLLKLPYLFLLAFFLMISSSIQSKLKADEVLGMRVLPQKDEERILFYIKKSKEAKKRKESLNTFAALVYGYEETNFSLGEDKSQLDSSFKFRFDSSSQVKRSWRTLIPIPKKKYNIVIYLFESTSRKYLNLMFHNRNVTPHWNELLENSIDFKNHYSGNPLSINALFSILTSAYSAPADFWIAKEFPDIPLLSLPEILKKHSYETAYFHSGSLGYAGQLRFLKNRGLDLIQEEKDILHHRYKKRINWGLDDRALISSVVQFAKKAKQPYCMVISPLSPHHPYEIPERKFDISSGWKNKKEKAIKKGVTNLTQEKGREEYEETNHSLQNQIMNTTPKKQLSFRNYLNSLYYADFVMGTIVKELEKIPQKGENTIFFIVADHGEGFGQHRRNYNHPFYLYEENVHVPFILFNRKLFSKNISYDSISRHIDILPTILDMIGIQADSKHEGLSLLKRENHQIAPLYTSWRNHLAGLRDDKWKYIFNFQTGVEELYNLEKDPNETKNVVIQYHTIAKSYKKLLASLHDYQRKYFQTVLKRKINWKRKTDKTGL